VSVTAILQKVPLFSQLAPVELERVAEITRERSYPRNSVILFEDDPGDALYVVATGQVKVVLIGEDGREVILSVLGEGDFFGEMSLIDEEPRSAHVIAMEDSNLLVIRRGGRDLRRPAGPVAIATASTMVVAILFGIISGELNPVPSWPSHGWLLLVGITSQSVGYLVISISLPRLPAALVSIILLAQPVATVVLARIIPSLDETPSLDQLLGVVLVIGGIAAATIPVGRLRDRARGALA